jgi:hypothetical protein
MVFACNLFENLDENLSELVLLLFNDVERVNIFCIKIRIKPKPNSTAERTKKKKVSDNILMLS